MEELNVFYIIETSDNLYVVEDDIFEGKVLDGILELATPFETYESAQQFLKEMEDAHIHGKVRKAKTYISIDRNE